MNRPEYFPELRAWQVLALIIVLLFAYATSQAQSTPAAYFEQNCASCHTIGEGPSVGPDLKNVTNRAYRYWLIEFIRDPEKKIAAKDPYAMQILKQADGTVMPGAPDISKEFGEELLEYIDQKSGAPVATGAPVPPGDASRGRELFLGKRNLAHGGAACIACHQASGLPTAGGRLGPDLSPVYQKLGGDKGLSSWLQRPPSKMMSTIFRTAPLTAGEAADLAAFFGASSENSGELRLVPVRRVQAIGLGGSLLVLLIAGVIWRNRLAIHDVRPSIEKRGGQ